MNEEISIDGDIVNESFSMRTPRVTLKPLRYLYRNSQTRTLLKVGFYTLLGGLLCLALWSKILGGIVSVLGCIIMLLPLRLIANRKVEFENALLSPGIIIHERPPVVLILTNMATGGTDPTWAATRETCRSVRPYPCKEGTRVPCVCAFTGSGMDGSWDRAVGSVLSDGCGDLETLNRALARIDEDEWEILTGAFEQGKVPGISETLRL